MLRFSIGLQAKQGLGFLEEQWLLLKLLSYGERRGLLGPRTCPSATATAASLGLHLLLSQRRGMHFPEEQGLPYLWPGLLLADKCWSRVGGEQGLCYLYMCGGRCWVADLCRRETLDKVCINVGTFHETFPRSRLPCTPSSHLLASLFYLAPCVARIQSFASTFS